MRSVALMTFRSYWKILLYRQTSPLEMVCFQLNDSPSHVFVKSLLSESMSRAFLAGFQLTLYGRIWVTPEV